MSENTRRIRVRKRPDATDAHEDEMVKFHMRKPLFGLLILVALGTHACPGTSGSSADTTVADAAQEVDIPPVDTTFEDVDDAVPPEPSLEVAFGDPPKTFCKCPAAGWCAVTDDSQFEIKVYVSILNKPSGKGGVSNVELLYTDPQGEVISIDDTSKGTDDENGDEYFSIQFFSEYIDTGEGYADGLLELTIQVDTDLEIPLSTSETITVLVDTTPPTPEMKDNGDFVIYAPKAGGVYAQHLPVKYCVSDKHPVMDQGPGAGMFPDGVTFKLVKDGVDTPLPYEGAVDLICNKSDDLLLEVAQANTDSYEFVIVMEDCVGNVGEASIKDVTVVGLPDYEVPSKDCFGCELSCGLGAVTKTRPVHLGTKVDGQVFLPDDHPDLVLFGEAGIAFVLNDGNGHIGIPEVVQPGLVPVDGYAWDVNDDEAADLVLLEVDGEGASFLRVYLQDVKWDSDESSWEPNGTFTTGWTEEYALSETPFWMMDRYDVNGDGFDDLVVAGGDDEETAVLLLHTKEVAPHTDPTPDPDADPDEEWNPAAEKPVDDKGVPLYVTDAPDQPNHFIIHDKLQGIEGISDIYIGQFRHEVLGSLGSPEIAVVRPEFGLLTVVPLDDEFKFGSGLDTTFCWGSVSMIAKPAELRRVAGDGNKDTSEIWHHPDAPGIEDLVVYSETTTSLHFVPSKGNGQFDLLSKVFPALLCSYSADEAAEVDPDDEDCEMFAEDGGFGQQHVAGSVSFLFGHQASGRADYGYTVYVGETPDGVWLGDIAPSPLNPDGNTTDGTMDLIVPVPGHNHVAFHPGVGIEGAQAGQFGYGRRGNPGVNPHACTIADFDLDNVLDVFCMGASGIGIQSAECEPCEEGEKPVVECATQFSSTSQFLTSELALPLGVDWAAGAVTPTHFLVADIEEDGDNDIIVATLPETMNYKADYESDESWTDQWDTSGMDTVSVPLILAYRLESGIQLTDLPEISPVDLDFNQKLSSIDTGDFNQDGEPDLVVSMDVSAGSVCDGRTVDLLLGNRGIDGIVLSEKIGSSGNLTQYDVQSSAEGQFLPLGGFLLLQNVTGVMTAQLNNDAIDDLIVFAKEYGSPGQEGFQPDRIATYLTVYDSKWNTCANDQYPYFDWAPIYPPRGIDLPVCGTSLPDPPEEGEEGLEYDCLPTFHLDQEAAEDPTEDYGDYGLAGLLKGQARPSMKTEQWETGKEPIAGTTGDFFSLDGTGADGCVDFFVASAGSHNATFVRGVCIQDNYQFETPVYQFPIGSHPVAIQTADLNHDEFIDVVAALGDQISFMYGVSGELFDSPQYLNKGADYQDLAPTSIEVEDVNDDGWVDLLVISSNHDAVLIYLNGGVSSEDMDGPPPYATQFLGPYLVPAGVDPVAILVAPIFTDIASDPKDDCNDVAVLNAGSGTVTLLRNRRCKQ